MLKALAHVSILVLLAVVFSCEDQITSECDTKSEIDNTSLEPTLANIQSRVFDTYCISCHGGSAPQGNLDLSSSNAYLNLVDAASTSSSLKRVVPGNSNDSYLLKRINGEGSGGVMPPSGKMSAELLELVEMWIDDGAQNN